MGARLREVILWTGAVLGLLSVVAGTAVMFFGFTFLIFRSGSMGPDIPTGSLALARTTPAPDLEAGDVVSVLAANGARVTHRLVSSTLRGDEASLVLQGDANGTPDDEIYQVTEAEVEIASVPYAGYVVTVLLSPAGLIAAGCLGAMMVLLAFGSQPERPDGPPRTGRQSDGGRHRGDRSRDARRARAGVGAAAALVVVASVAGTSVSSTAAFFTDSATARTGTFSADTVAPPTNIGCNVNNLQGTITWNAPVDQPLTGYRISYVLQGTPGTTTLDRAANPTNITFNFPTTNSNYTYVFTVSTIQGPWVSEASTSVSFTGRRVLLSGGGVLGTQLTCSAASSRSEGAVSSRGRATTLTQ